jgi:hypothetical protein|tara:strand:+ start:11600 stop:12805 length:1206 start_codon:yes stop_codon:yes gene_type:complete
MAVYKIFPSKDSTLYSYYPVMNTGLDAICEVSNTLDPIMRGEVPMVARYLMQFKTEDIKDVIDNKIGTHSYDVFLKNYISTAKGMNQETSIQFHPLAQFWNNGTGHYLDNPDVDNGVSWNYTKYSGSGAWSLSGSINGWNYTGSWTGSNENAKDAVGGGNWIFDTGSTQYAVHGYMSPSYVQGSSLNLPITQSFGLRSVKDIEINVNNIIDVWYNEAIPNYGFIAKLTGSDEFNKSKYIQPVLKYYSVDTNTIYPPQLEFRWRDYTSTISPSSSLIVTNTDIKLSVEENPGTFNQNAINKFYIDVAPLYPSRVFQTSSLYTGLHYLPTSSYYAIKDLDTNEFVINFDTQYTQISSDSRGNYFDIYMDGLEPERYYSILIKTEIDGSTLVIEDDNYFKVING